MSGQVLGVAAWLLAWASSVGVEPHFAGASAATEGITEGEVSFDVPVALVVPSTLPLEGDAADRFALLEYALAGEHNACTYLSDGTKYQRVHCSSALPEGDTVSVDYVAVWSDVQDAQRASGGRIFIDFTGGGVVLRCDGAVYYLSDVRVDEVDFAAYCSAG